MTVFDGLLEGLDIAVDHTFGEAFDIRPQKKAPDVNARPAADPARAAQAGVTGVWIEPFSRAAASTALRVEFKTERPGHASSRPGVSLVLASLSWRPREGDEICRIKTGEVFRIAEVREDGLHRLVCDLNHVGACP